MSGQEQFLFELICPTRLDKTQVTLFVGTIDFIPDDGIAEMRQVYSDLMRSSRDGTTADEGKGNSVSGKALENVEVSRRWFSLGMNALLEPDRTIGNFPLA
jgi:hypothetical protein